jgi:hypothetical protein
MFCDATNFVQDIGDWDVDEFANAASREHSLGFRSNMHCDCFFIELSDSHLVSRFAAEWNVHRNHFLAHEGHDV